LSTVTSPGVWNRVAMVSPSRRNEQWLPGGDVVIAIFCDVPSMMVLHPARQAAATVLDTNLRNEFIVPTQMTSMADKILMLD